MIQTYKTASDKQGHFQNFDKHPTASIKHLIGPITASFYSTSIRKMRHSFHSGIAHLTCSRHSARFFPRCGSTKSFSPSDSRTNALTRDVKRVKKVGGVRFPSHFYMNDNALQSSLEMNRNIKLCKELENLSSNSPRSALLKEGSTISEAI